MESLGVGAEELGGREHEGQEGKGMVDVNVSQRPGVPRQKLQGLTWRSVTRANTRLVRASATASRAATLGSSRLLTGCSPRAVAAPTSSW